jgi:RNA polymerase sigma-70 factor (ECF subfamily)
MATAPLKEAVQQVRRAMLVRDGGGLSDGQLLERYVTGQEEAAFEALVQRLGPMVLGVCRRILRHHQDAEDAFQAAFLVLAKRAAYISPRDRVGPFLYGVAFHTAIKAKARILRRRRRQLSAAEAPEPVTTQADDWHDLRPVLEQEIHRLSEKYRAPVVLCDVEGLTRAEAARRLDWPEGTVSGRLSRARALLARRLARRGVTLSMGVGIVFGADKEATAFHSALVRSTLEAVSHSAAARSAAPCAALTEGVLTNMLMSKGKPTLLILIVAGLLAWGTRSLQLGPANGAAPPPVRSAPSTPPPRPVTVARDDRGLIQGTWKVVAFEANGKRHDMDAEAAEPEPRGGVPPFAQDCRWTFDRDRLWVEGAGTTALMRFKMDLTKIPRRIDLTFSVPLGPVPSQSVAFGIYELHGDRLMVCLTRAGLPRVQRPAEFETEPGVPVELYTLLRVPSTRQPKDPDKRAEVSAKEPARIGQIFIVGNEKTGSENIQRCIPLYPGQILMYPDLKAAERNLTEIGIRATVTVMDPEHISAIKDIVIRVQEEQTGSLIFGTGASSDAGLTGSIRAKKAK